MKQNQALAETAPLLEKAYGRDLAERVMTGAQQELKSLCDAHARESKAVRQHTVEVIYPIIALYRVMEREGIDKQEALAFLDRSCSTRAEKSAKSIRTMLKIPGLYHLMPTIFRWVTIHQFGREAGFEATFYPTDHTRVKFDMTKCLYCDVCRANGCPELVPCFCHTDDVTDGNMHPKLLWNRTKIMGDGGDVCDFDLVITDRKEAPPYRPPEK